MESQRKSRGKTHCNRFYIACTRGLSQDAFWNYECQSNPNRTILRSATFAHDFRIGCHSPNLLSCRASHAKSYPSLLWSSRLRSFHEICDLRRKCYGKYSKIDLSESKLNYCFQFQFERDVNVWNHKKFAHNPCLAKEDRCIKLFRQWYSQFYSENSKTYQQAKESLEW